jgi:hypothetical protein
VRNFIIPFFCLNHDFNKINEIAKIVEMLRATSPCLLPLTPKGERSSLPSGLGCQDVANNPENQVNPGSDKNGISKKTINVIKQ